MSRTPDRIQILFLSVILLSITASFQSCRSPRSDAQQATAVDSSKVVDIDDLVRNPTEYTGLIWVSGSVSDVDLKSSAFILGCEDACIGIPVRYSGDLPAIQENIEVHGRIEQDRDSRFFFNATEYRVK